MSHQFSLKTFLRKVPYDLLQQYFTTKNVLTNFVWGSEIDVDKLSIGLYELGEHGVFVTREFERINEAASEAGSQQLVDASKSPIFGLDIAEQIESTYSHHQRAMYVFLNHPEVFRCAMEMMYIDSLSSSSWKACRVGTNLPYTDDTEIRERFGAAIGEYYCSQGRGKNCIVDYYFRVNPDRHCFFAYPEDYATEDLVYENPTRLGRQVRRPVMEVIFVYRPDTGILEVHANGSKSAKALQEVFCKTLLELDGVPDESTRVYDLFKLKDPNFRFVTDPADNIESVTLKMLGLELPGLNNRKVTVEAQPSPGADNIVFEMLSKESIAYNCSIDAIYIKRAKIAVKFRSPRGERAKSVTFTITAPNGCTLNDEHHNNIIKRYLEKWGFIKHLLDQEDAA